ncbi:class I SAM-dependent methyltransferase [Caulobacter sp. S45]|uniref:class I SAM-dependent methyltransferase n=1 Tax=Caulobacter sp. S45 TaxID=1641861 RepID=UPI00131CE5AD|nr:SAM-dependent methyltransferase [Caulobacter sp. S45]
MTPLARRLAERIAEDGPMTAADYMTACLHDPQHGYYATRPRLGADGDFVTAPLVSQMFGELIGTWIAEVWVRLGRPSSFRLVEVGPGDGKLMSDALRALTRAPGLLEAADLWLVEPSEPLRKLQAERLAGQPLRWAARLAQVPDGAPIILVANELLDCLPARQFLRMGGAWAERRIGLDDEGRLAFGLAPPPPDFQPPPGLEQTSEGVVVELSPAQAKFGAQVGARVAQDGGAALLIDYGRDRVEAGDTLQAVIRHRKVDPLADPGEADITVYADFPTVVAAALAAGAEVSPILGQGALLRRLGIELRAAALIRARPDLEDRIGRQLARLIDNDQMGALFKALAIHQNGLSVPGFEEGP